MAHPSTRPRIENIGFNIRCPLRQGMCWCQRTSVVFLKICARQLDFFKSWARELDFFKEQGDHVGKERGNERGSNLG